MNSIHDMGGMHGFGPVNPEPNEPVFHHAWEARAFGIAAGVDFNGFYNVDQQRHSVERIGALNYLSGSYYENWIAGLELILSELGYISRAELDARRAGQPYESNMPPKPAPALLKGEDIPQGLRVGGSRRVNKSVAPRFRVGDHVLMRNFHPEHHTRLPRYARGRRGIVEIDHGVFVFPDTAAHQLGNKPQHVYSVRFTARELWGPEASPRDTLRLDIWDDYMDLVV